MRKLAGYCAFRKGSFVACPRFGRFSFAFDLSEHLVKIIDLKGSSGGTPDAIAPAFSRLDGAEQRPQPFDRREHRDCCPIQSSYR